MFSDIVTPPCRCDYIKRLAFVTILGGTFIVSYTKAKRAKFMLTERKINMVSRKISDKIEIDYIRQLLLEMKADILKNISLGALADTKGDFMKNDASSDPKRIVQAEAINEVLKSIHETLEAIDIALMAIDEKTECGSGPSRTLIIGAKKEAASPEPLMDYIVQNAADMIAKDFGADVEYGVYPTNDGRMKYELYVKVKE